MIPSPLSRYLYSNRIKKMIRLINIPNIPNMISIVIYLVCTYMEISNERRLIINSTSLFGVSSRRFPARRRCEEFSDCTLTDLEVLIRMFWLRSNSKLTNENDYGIVWLFAKCLTAHLNSVHFLRDIIPSDHINNHINMLS